MNILNPGIFLVKSDLAASALNRTIQNTCDSIICISENVLRADHALPHTHIRLAKLFSRRQLNQLNFKRGLGHFFSPHLVFIDTQIVSARTVRDKIHLPCDHKILEFEYNDVVDYVCEFI